MNTRVQQASRRLWQTFLAFLSFILLLNKIRVGAKLIIFADQGLNMFATYLAQRTLETEIVGVLVFAGSGFLLHLFKAKWPRLWGPTVVGVGAATIFFSLQTFAPIPAFPVLSLVPLLAGSYAIAQGIGDTFKYRKTGSL